MSQQINKMLKSRNVKKKAIDGQWAITVTHVDWQNLFPVPILALFFSSSLRCPQPARTKKQKYFWHMNPCCCLSQPCHSSVLPSRPNQNAGSCLHNQHTQVHREPGPEDHMRTTHFVMCLWMLAFWCSNGHNDLILEQIYSFQVSHRKVPKAYGKQKFKCLLNWWNYKYFLC